MNKTDTQTLLQIEQAIIGSRDQDRHRTIIMKIKRLCTFNNVLTFKVIADIMKFYKKDSLSQKSKQYSNCMVRFWQEVNVYLQ